MTARSEFFDTFGFLYLPGLLADDIGWISEEFDAIWARRDDVRHDGTKRTMYPGSFFNASPVLARLIEHRLLSDLCEELLGSEVGFYGGDGNYYAGDTLWHSDVFKGPDGHEAKTIVRHLKIGFYLDPLTADTGALRVIPGSHHASDAFAGALSRQLPDSETVLGVAPRAIPAVALETTPGDIVVFDHRIKHASFGGGPARRMFAMNLFGQCRTDRQREVTARIFYMYGEQGVSHFFSDSVSVDAPPARLRRLEPVLQFEPARAEGFAEYLRRQSDSLATA